MEIEQLDRLLNTYGLPEEGYELPLDAKLQDFQWKFKWSDSPLVINSNSFNLDVNTSDANFFTFFNTPGTLKIFQEDQEHTYPIYKRVYSYYELPTPDNKNVSLIKHREYTICDEQARNIVIDILRKENILTYNGVFTIKSDTALPVVIGSISLITNILNFNLNNPNIITIEDKLIMDKELFYPSFENNFIITTQDLLETFKYNYNVNYTENEKIELVEQSLATQITIEDKEEDEITYYPAHRILKDQFAFDKNGQLIDIVFQENLIIDNPEVFSLYKQHMLKQPVLEEFTGEQCLGNDSNLKCRNIVRTLTFKDILDKNTLIVEERLQIKT